MRQICILLACFAINRPVGFGAGLVQLNTEAVEYYNLRQYHHAEQLWLEALRLSPIINDVIASNLAALYRRTGRYSEAEQYFNACYESRKSRLGDDHTDTAIALNNIATLEMSLGLFVQANQHFKQALSASRLTAKDKASIETNLANLLRITGHPVQARNLLFKTLETSVTAAAYMNLGRLAEDDFDYQAAFDYYQAARASGAVIGAHLGRLKLLKGDFDAARQLLEQELLNNPSAEDRELILQLLNLHIKTK